MIAVGELQCVALHPLRMLASAGVLRPQGARESGDRLLVRTLEQTTLRALDLDQVAQVARIQNELLFAGATLRAPHRRAGGGTSEALDDTEQLERPEGLQEQCVRAGGAGNVLHVVHPGEQDDADRARVGAFLQLATEGETVHARHADIEHDHVRPLGGDPLFRLGCASGLVHVDLDVFERRAQQGAES